MYANQESHTPSGKKSRQPEAIHTQAGRTRPDREKSTPTRPTAPSAGIAAPADAASSADAASAVTWPRLPLLMGALLACGAQDVLKECVQTALLLTLLDRLGLMSGQDWLERHLDQLSVQAVMFSGKAMSWTDRVKAYMAHTARIEADD